MAGIWGMLAFPTFIVVLFVIGLDAGFSITNISGIFWVMSAVIFLLGLCYCSLLLMILSVSILYLSGSGKLRG